MAIHICHVFPDFERGGSEVRTASVMNGLGSDFRHTVVALGGNTGCRAHVDAAVDVTYVDVARSDGRKPGARELGKRLKAMQPDLLLTYNWGAMDAGIGAVLRRIRPWVQVLDGFTAEEAERQLLRRRLMRSFFYRRADAVVCVSRNLERIALELWKIARERVLYLPNGVDTEHFSPGSGASVRDALGAGDDCLVGTIANLRPEKDPALLLEAFGRLEVPAHLAYVGRAAHYRDTLHARAKELGIAERVHFLDKVDDTTPYHRAFDIFALSSRTEQMPLTVMEAMACGKPIVGTDVGDVKAMVAGENRPFVVGREPSVFAAALSAVAGDRELRATLGERNRARAVEEFRLDAMVEAFRQLFQRLCGSA